MGFHIHCSGANLLYNLRNNADGFLKEPYGMYIVALATKIDDEAISWLKEYEMQLDSLTGPYAAFMLFYNKAILSAEPYPRPWARYEMNNDELNESITIEVKSSLLSSGAGMVDNVLRHDPRAHTDKNILLTSMTYESDVVARHLGIIEHMPCLVIFDDPSSSDFYILPIEESDKKTIEDLRELISLYLSDSKNEKFIKLLDWWHQTNALKEKYNNELKFLIDSKAGDPEYIYKEVEIAKELLSSGKIKLFNETINSMEGRTGNIGRLPWSLIKRETKEIGAIMSMRNKLLSNKVPEQSKEKIKSLLKKQLAIKADNSILQICEIAEKSLKSKIEELPKLILTSLGLAENTDEIPKPILRKKEEIEKQAKVLSNIEEEIKKEQRPVIKDFIKKINRARKIEKSKRFLTGKMDVASQRIPSVLESIGKGIELFGS